MTKTNLDDEIISLAHASTEDQQNMLPHIC